MASMICLATLTLPSDFLLLTQLEHQLMTLSKKVCFKFSESGNILKIVCMYCKYLYVWQPCHWFCLVVGTHTSLAFLCRHSWNSHSWGEEVIFCDFECFLKNSPKDCALKYLFVWQPLVCLAGGTDTPLRLSSVDAVGSLTAEFGTNLSLWLTACRRRWEGKWESTL